MRMYDIIKKKRDGGTLTSEEISFAVRGFVDGTVSECQMSGLCMAVFFRGLDKDECAALTGEMTESGDVLDLSSFGDDTVDKHSTGGVGDKTTLVLAPICAAMGLKVAKMSGRRLGHTGGTVDKLESIPGFCTEYSGADFLSLVEKYGIAVAGQSLDFVPADKKLYALRDECAEVESIPLIASSIMSKKLACGAKNIVLDVKCGSGAFMKDTETARLLGETMAEIGEAHGRRVTALITDMDRPLGRAVGNAIEVNEAVDVLRGQGPDDLRELCVTIATALYSMSRGCDEAESRDLAEAVLTDGRAYDAFIKWIGAQRGDVSVFDGDGHLPAAPVVMDYVAESDGYVTAMNCEGIGHAAMVLGASRSEPGGAVDHSVGIEFLKKTGDRVRSGDTVFRVFARDEMSGKLCIDETRSAVTMANEAPAPRPLILGRVDSVKKD